LVTDEIVNSGVSGSVDDPVVVERVVFSLVLVAAVKVPQPMTSGKTQAIQYLVILLFFIVILTFSRF